MINLEYIWHIINNNYTYFWLSWQNIRLQPPVCYLDIPERPSQPGTMAYIAKQEVSLTPRQKVKGPKCGQCEEKKAAVVRSK